ncbi:MAG TPA: methionyl-tRNA formyltransferase [Candidatus Binatia bacterium]|nr:methionyl-tRNA formyltransferase [Candidatus Binatia bacterium]
MRLVIVGQAAFGQRVLAGLAERGHEIAAAYAPPAKAGKPDPLAAEAEKRGIPVRTPATYKDPAVADEVRALAPDLELLAFVTKIIPPAVIDAPRLGTLCFHPSLLPRYRGGSALAWQLIRGETRGGFTVFWTDPGIDTGPILLQREIAIGPDDTAGSLYFDKIFEPGVAGMVEAVDLVASGRAPRIPQDESRATYDPLCTDEHAAVRWDRPAREVYDLVRGCDPQPGAHTRRGGETLRLYDARRAAAPGAAPGTVLAIDERGLVVAAGEGADAGAIAFGRVRGSAGKVKGADWAAEAGVRAGDRLG